MITYDLLEKGRYQYVVHKQSFWKLQSLTTKKFSQNIFAHQSKARKETLYGNSKFETNQMQATSCSMDALFWIDVTVSLLSAKEKLFHLLT